MSVFPEGRDAESYLIWQQSVSPWTLTDEYKERIHESSGEVEP